MKKYGHNLFLSSYLLVFCLFNLPSAFALEENYIFDGAWSGDPVTSPPWIYSGVRDVDIAPNGDVYISDDSKIYHFNGDGDFIDLWKSDLPSDNFYKYDIDIAADGNIYFSAEDSIQKYSPGGDLISTWEGEKGELFTVANGNP